jgi:starch synthase
MATKMNILFASAEVAPFAKVGGLGDVSGALPPALLENYSEMLDIRIIMPFHSTVKEKGVLNRKIGAFEFDANGQVVPCELFVASNKGVPVYLIDNQDINHNSPVYHGDWRLDGMKYAIFSLAVLEAARYLDWKIDILHANDWHTALAVYALRTRYKDDPFFAGVKTILSIHNLPYNGWGSQEAMASLGFIASDDQDLPDWAKFTPLPMGITKADKFIAVSPGYAREILTSEYGCGIENYLNLHADKVMGILNGIDESIWDPTQDTVISHNFSVEDLESRKKNKLDLQKALNFEVNEEIPLLTIVTRLSDQKGVPAILEGLPQLIDENWQFALLGTGNPDLEGWAKHLSEKNPDRIASFIKYDDIIARVLYASGDMFLMPSLYEPCGLSQMFSMRYGNLPVATATGGLSDSIVDYSTDPDHATGFLYQEKTTQGLVDALRLALETYKDKVQWQKMQENGMKTDFSWATSAEKYYQVYQNLMNKD